MKINVALILCAGFGKRLNPLTLNTPKPLLEINNITLLENCINLVIKLGIKKIFINVFHLSDQIIDFIKKNNFPIDIQIIKDGKEILDTGGGILNMMNQSQNNDFLIFNPDTLWNSNYIKEINEMMNFYFSNNLNNILMLTNKKISFDKNLKGDFDLKKNQLLKNNKEDYIYTGCQILNRNLFSNYEIKNFSITEIWNELLEKDCLNGFESLAKFYHLANLKTFKKLKDL